MKVLSIASCLALASALIITRPIGHQTGIQRVLPVGHPIFHTESVNQFQHDGDHHFNSGFPGSRKPCKKTATKPKKPCPRGQFSGNHDGHGDDHDGHHGDQHGQHHGESPKAPVVAQAIPAAPAPAITLAPPPPAPADAAPVDASADAAPVDGSAYTVDAAPVEDDTNVPVDPATA